MCSRLCPSVVSRRVVRRCGKAMRDFDSIEEDTCRGCAVVHKRRVKGSIWATTFLNRSDADSDKDHETVLTVLWKDDGTNVVPLEVEMPEGVPAACILFCYILLAAFTTS